MDSGGFNWSILTILGPLLIVIVLAWAAMRNKKSSRAEVDRTEASTRDLYREEDAAHRDDNTMGT
jgi:nitrate/nitrite transporter NarK